MSSSIKLHPTVYFPAFLRESVQNPCQKISVVESVFNKITGIDFRPATLLKRCFHQGRFLFLVKLRGLQCRATILLK